ncbi:MAG TPA: universal stress protein [Chloroflexota bacterium]|nr:universal stress protein [Chloroflexota bacterium]
MTPIDLLLATDGSEPSLAAARLVRDLLSPAALARVTLLAVVAPIDTLPFYGGFAAYGGGVVSQEAWDEMATSAERAAQEALQRTVAELHTTVPVDSVIRRGSPAAEIVRYANEIGAGLIVMGSRGWGEMHAMLLGSASERVLHTASCPVLIVRSTETRAT